MSLLYSSFNLAIFCFFIKSGLPTHLSFITPRSDKVAGLFRIALKLTFFVQLATYSGWLTTFRINQLHIADMDSGLPFLDTPLWVLSVRLKVFGYQVYPFHHNPVLIG